MKLLNKGLRVHDKKQCKGQKCCLHNPSNHHMKDWPIFIRMDKHTLAERICKHGVGHPDPDSVEFLVGCVGNVSYYADYATALLGKEEKDSLREVLGTHGCDGCCLGDKKCSTKKRKR